MSTNLREQWAKIPRFPNYEISNSGLVFRVGRTKRTPVKVTISGNYISCFLTDSTGKSKQVNLRMILDECFEDHIYKDHSVDSLEGEVWKDVVGWEESHEVSNLGRLRTKARTRVGKGGSISSVSTKIKETYYDQDGYERVCLYQDNRNKLMGVHRVVAQAFVPNPDDLSQVNHKNGNKKDNRAENLEWVSNTQNIEHSIEFGLRDPHFYSYHIVRESDGKHFRSVSALQREIGLSYNKLVHIFKNSCEPVRIGEQVYTLEQKR